MVITYTCRDVGVDCDWSASSETEEGLMELIGEHAKIVHPEIELTRARKVEWLDADFKVQALG